MPNDQIVVRGAREHNLKNVDLTLPRGKIVVFTGPGSGQVVARLRHDLRRRAATVRRVAQRLRATVPRAAREARRRAHRGAEPGHRDRAAAASKSPRSTVGTVTEIADYLRLLYARVGVPHCPSCGKRIEAQTVQQIVDRVLALPEGHAGCSFLRPSRAPARASRSSSERRREGFVRARIDGSVVDLGDEIELDDAPRRTTSTSSSTASCSRRGSGAPHRQRRARAQARRGAPADADADDEGDAADASASPASTAASRFRDRAAHVLVQRPARRVPRVRRPRRRDVVDPERAWDERGTPARGRRARLGTTRQRRAGDRGARRSTCSASDPTRPGASCPRSSAEPSCFGRRQEPKKGVRADGDHTGSAAPLRRPACRGRGTTEHPDAGEGDIADDELGRVPRDPHCDACKGKRLRPKRRREARRRHRHRRDAAPASREVRREPSADAALAQVFGSQREQPIARAAAQGGRRAPRLPHRRGPRLPHARPQRADALRRRGSAHPAGDADRRGARRRALRARRAERRPPRARQRAPHRGAERACATSATRSSSSSTTARRSSRPTTSSTWARAPACTAGRSSRRARPRMMVNPESRSPARFIAASASSPCREAHDPRARSNRCASWARAHTTCTTSTPSSRSASSPASPA